MKDHFDKENPEGIYRIPQEDATSYKATLHVPIEQYGFIAIECENTPTGLVEAYRAIAAANTTVVNQLPAKEFNAAIDEYLLTNALKGGVEIYYRMSPQQQFTFQEIKKSLKRIKSRETNVEE